MASSHTSIDPHGRHRKSSAPTRMSWRAGMQGSEPATWLVNRSPRAARRSRSGVSNSVAAVAAEEVPVQAVEQHHDDVSRRRMRPPLREVLRPLSICVRRHWSPVGLVTPCPISKSPTTTCSPASIPVQREAVTHHDGPLLVVAGAGSGKTRVLTHRIAHLIHDHGVSPFEILAITFTNKAADEMKQRVEALVGPVARKMWVSTFHSACVRILRREAAQLGLSVQLHDLRPGRRRAPRRLRHARPRARPEAVPARVGARRDQRRQERRRVGGGVPGAGRSHLRAQDRRHLRRVPAAPRTRPAPWTSTTSCR